MNKRYFSDTVEAVVGAVILLAVWVSLMGLASLAQASQTPFHCIINPYYPGCEQYANPPSTRTTTFTETGANCNASAAYWEARNDVDRHCRALGGRIVSGYSVPSYRRITTGSCHDPNGGNGLGTYHIYKVRATCRH